MSDERFQQLAGQNPADSDLYFDGDCSDGRHPGGFDPLEIADDGLPGCLLEEEVDNELRDCSVPTEQEMRELSQESGVPNDKSANMYDIKIVKGYYWFSAQCLQRFPDACAGPVYAGIVTPGGKVFTCVTTDAAGAGYRWPDKELVEVGPLTTSVWPEREYELWED